MEFPVSVLIIKELVTMGIDTGFLMDFLQNAIQELDVMYVFILKIKDL